MTATPDQDAVQRLLGKASQLLAIAKVFAIGTYTTILERFPTLSSLLTDQWDFILTTAGIFVAASQLNHESITEHAREQILSAITETANKENSDYAKACEDCRKFVDRTYDGLTKLLDYKHQPAYLFSDSLGGWITWNLYGHSPEGEEERHLARTLGALTVHAFINYWKEDL